MKITVHAKPMAARERVEKISESEYRVSVKEPPVKGLANAAIAKALAAYFKIPPSHIKLISGFASRRKVFEVSASE